MFFGFFRNVVFSHRNIFKHQFPSFLNKYYSKDLTKKVLPSQPLNSRPKKRKDIVSLSQNALNRLYEIIAGTDKVVYLTLRVKGCNGYVYEMNLVEDSNLKEMDEKIYDSNGKLVLGIENKAAFYLLGSYVDYSKDDLSEGFTFDNPNVTSKCGCGMSFRF
uniref:HesB family member, putative n=1 Tax=Theileria annulata TaxID=5874 RepID=A0A3B0NKT9_THEAN